MPRYSPASIEPKWQRYWDEHKTFKTPDMLTSEKQYLLDMFPYPSGAGLHVGHPEGYTATDIVSRFARMNGKCVLHPMGFDAFGLPAEEHAIKTNTPPRMNTEQNIATFKRQLKMLGFSYDWERELATTDVEYFRWTQWIFLVLFDTWFDPEQQKGRPIRELPIPQEIAAQGQAAIRKYQDDHRLAYQSDALVNWCPAWGTVLANEEVDFAGLGIWGSLASWEDSNGTRWLLAPIWGPLTQNVKYPMTNGDAPHGSIVAFKVEEKNGKTVLAPAWVSRDLIIPAPPVIANGVVFALSSGEFVRQANENKGGLFSSQQRADQSVHAVLYALDAETGKELYSSGDSITSFTHFAGMSVANGRVYFGTYDNTLYSFGLPIEH